MVKLVVIVVCVAGLTACSYTQRDVALVPVERPVITTVPAPQAPAGTTIYRYEEYKADPWLPY